MNWLVEQYERERRADELREAQRVAKFRMLLAQDEDKNQNKNKPDDKKVRRALGSKLIEWGEQLQDGGARNPLTAEI
ncbi:MAG: hypothetical protein IT331_14765 [Anaerolineae bacterium]|nr:hypothetical protein [Anaerolineae bacterium]